MRTMGSESAGVKIDRIPCDTSAEVFRRDYFDPEIPVIITDVTAGWPAAQKWNLQHLSELLATRPDLERSQWFQMEDSLLGDDYEQPAVVTAALAPELSVARLDNVRVWLHERGHTTSLHHDGNLLFVFNVQVKGTKSWRLISPHSHVAYNFLSRVPVFTFHSAPADEIRRMGVELLEFDLQEGEMVYIPPLWAHQVVSVGHENINLNWVATRRAPKPSHRLRREQEVLGTMQRLVSFRPTEILLNRLLGGSTGAYLENFAGVGEDLVDQLTSDVNRRAVARRLVTEIATIPRALAFKFQRRKQVGTPLVPTKR